MDLGKIEMGLTMSQATFNEWLKGLWKALNSCVSRIYDIQVVVEIAQIWDACLLDHHPKAYHQAHHKSASWA